MRKRAPYGCWLGVIFLMGIARMANADVTVPEDAFPIQLGSQLGVAFLVTFLSNVNEAAEANDTLLAQLPTLGTRDTTAEDYGQLVDANFVFNPNLIPISTVTVTGVAGSMEGTSDFVRSWSDGFGHFAVNFTSDSAPAPPPPPVPEPSTLLLISSGLLGLLAYSWRRRTKVA